MEMSGFNNSGEENSVTGGEGMAREAGTAVTAGATAAAAGGAAGVVVGVVVGSMMGFLAGSLIGMAIGERSGFWLARGK